MKMIKLMAATMALALSAQVAQAQVVKRTPGGDSRRQQASGGLTVTGRQQSFYEVSEPSDADLQWMKVVYRSLDLTKGKNPALYYPDEPNEDGQDLFFIIMRQLADGNIPAYEYLDGREMFTDQYRIKVRDMLDRFHVLYAEAKGSTAKNPKFKIEDADIPANEVLSYYIIEKWEFDTRSNQMKSRVEAVCPVLHRTDDYGGEPLKYPMFWVKLNDIRPYMAQQYVFTDDDNNLSRYNLDDFFKLKMYTGDIYKVKNLRNLSLAQQFPDPEKLKQAQDSIEQRLRSFDKNLWVPSREELQARAEAKAKLEAERNAEITDADDDSAADAPKATKSVSKRAKTKRGAAKAKTETKKTAIKTRKPKAAKPSSSSAGSVRSVRNRKR